MTSLGAPVRAVVLDDLGVLSETAEPIDDVVPLLRAAGLAVAVLSNADGPPRPGLPEVDAVLLSGTTGVRKPHPAAFVLAAAALGAQPHETVVVDDLSSNVRGAAQAGCTAVLHVDRATTLTELSVLLARPGLVLPAAEPGRGPGDGPAGAGVVG